jgi:hypothetical protein
LINPSWARLAAFSGNSLTRHLAWCRPQLLSKQHCYPDEERGASDDSGDGDNGRPSQHIGHRPLDEE